MPDCTAVVMPAPNEPVRIESYPAPTLEPGAAILETLFSEVCGTDVHLHHGRLSGVPYPLIPGHVSVGRIAEMRTGEGKTLVATLPLYLNALSGRGVHLVTVNDYLAKRDVQWMGPVFHRLGLSVGVIQHDAAFVFDPRYDHPDPSLRQLRPAAPMRVVGALVRVGRGELHQPDRVDLIGRP